MRKDAQCLADKAVEQYKIAMSWVVQSMRERASQESLVLDVERINEIPEHACTPEQMAKVKALADMDY